MKLKLKLVKNNMHVPFGYLICLLIVILLNKINALYPIRHSTKYGNMRPLAVTVTMCRARDAPRAPAAAAGAGVRRGRGGGGGDTKFSFKVELHWNFQKLTSCLHGFTHTEMMKSSPERNKINLF